MCVVTRGGGGGGLTKKIKDKQNIQKVYRFIYSSKDEHLYLYYINLPHSSPRYKYIRMYIYINMLTLMFYHYMT